MENVLISAGVGVALVTAIIEALKRAGLRAKYAPLMNIFLGCAFSAVLTQVNHYAIETFVLMWASLSGVSALGYDTVKHAVANVSPSTEITSLQRRLSILQKQEDAKSDPEGQG